MKYYLVILMMGLILVSGCETQKVTIIEASDSPATTETSAVTNQPAIERTTTINEPSTEILTPTTPSSNQEVEKEKINYGTLYDAGDLLPMPENYNWESVQQDMVRVQNIIGTEAAVVSHASEDFELDGAKGNLLIIEGKTGKDAEKAVSGYLAKSSSWISSYEIQDEVEFGEGIKVKRLLTLVDNGGTTTLLWSGNAFAFSIFLSSREVNPYEKGKELSEEILKAYPFLYEEAKEGTQPALTVAVVELPTTTEETKEEATTVVDNSCSSNSACGYKKICRSGKCVSVQCTNDGQCSGCRKCSSNRCVRCGYGAAGYCTC
ncbi:MAG: hypothetical protein ABIH82_04950 [Candidatus Woesearchaeota archaeon]